MKKYGFTLAEVLIALGIIGVISSLTAPTFISNIQNSSNAARLASAVATLENGFTTMIAKEGVDNLFETEAWEEQNNRREFAGKVGDFISITGFRQFNNANEIRSFYNQKGPYLMNSNGSRQSNVNNVLAGYFVQPASNGSGGSHSLELKSGAMVFLQPNNEVSQAVKDTREDAFKAVGGSVFSIAADVCIDVNGASAPNTLGRDIFAFYLGENGKLYPLGGKDVSIYDSNGANANDIWSNASSRRRCLDGNIGDGYGCTARVVADGYKINY